MAIAPATDTPTRTPRLVTAPWSVEDTRQSTELTCVLDAEGNRVAQWVPAALAPLVAAAPDLLAALKAIEKDADWTGWHADRQHAAMQIVRSAIAKAEGR